MVLSQARLITTLLLVLVTVTKCHDGAISYDFFIKFYDKENFLAHGIRSNIDFGATDAFAEGANPTYICGPSTSLEAKFDAVRQVSADSINQVVFVSKSQDLGCFVSTANQDAIVASIRDDPAWTVNRLPSALKIHTSVLQYFSYITRDISNAESETGLVSTFKPLKKRFGDVALGDDYVENYLTLPSSLFVRPEVKVKDAIVHAKEGSVLAIELHPMLIGSASIRDVAKALFTTAADVSSVLAMQGRFPLTPAMKTIYSRIASVVDPSSARTAEVADIIGRHLSSLGACKIPATAEIMYQRASIEISNLVGIDDTCLFGLIQLAAASPQVARVTITGRPQLMNFEARGLTQTGSMGDEPYRDAGLTGSGQIVGVSDSGVNDLSCFFIDDSGAYDSPVTNRTGKLEPMRRKIIQYTAYADSFDEQGGHGTHVCGSIVGNSQGDLSSMNGIAPDAKISFFDLGVTGMNYLKVPIVTEIFESAYKSGARVHTNSWGNPGGIYGQISTDVDQFMVDHPDSLILYSAGNNGLDGLHSIVAPANSKNALTVGATQTRSVFEDKELTTDDEYSRLACFSSLGPTVDGRIKPDVVAPGDFIMSAYSGPVDLTEEALSVGVGTETCAAHQMSGTSMATPITAGNALLIRQFFMDPRYWASICDKSLPQCFKGGYLTPSGYLLKAMFLHSGEPIKRYSDPVYDAEPTRFPSFELKSKPLDVFQGHGEVRLKNVLPLANGKGLDPRLNLYVWDNLKLTQHETIKIDVVLPASRMTAMYNLPIKVTLCWFDPPSPMGSVSSLLLHDIDLVVQGPDGSLHWGNAHAASDPFSAGSEAPEHFRLHGVPFGSNSSSPGFAWADDKNPNEQVLIERPQSICYKAKQDKNRNGRKSSSGGSDGGGSGLDVADDDNGSVNGDGNVNQSGQDCVFSIYVHANSLLANPSRTQNVAVVVTTAGQVTAPERIVKWFSDCSRYNPPLPSKPVATYTGKVMHIDATLSGGEFVNITSPVDTCTNLNSIDVSVHFKQVSSAAVLASPANLELTIVDANGHAVSLGGADSSVGIARITTEWPDSWLARKSGFYSASINVAQAKLGSSGGWKMYVMNSWSASTKVEYNVTAGLNFEGLPRWATGASCAPTAAPTPSTSAAPTASQHPTAAPTKVPASYAEYVIPFQDIKLGVVQTETGLHQQRLLLHEFNFTGHLESIELVLSGSRNAMPLHGTDAWLLGVAVTDPSGLTAQVGGWKWFKQGSKFYARRWPDPWIGRDSADGVWHGSRDVHAAGLRNRTFIRRHPAPAPSPHHDDSNKHHTVKNTSAPTPTPSKWPSAAPSSVPTLAPTHHPTLSPTAAPTRTPTSKPTGKVRPPWLPGPSAVPTSPQKPSARPSNAPAASGGESDKHRHRKPSSIRSTTSTNGRDEGVVTTSNTVPSAVDAFQAEGVPSSPSRFLRAAVGVVETDHSQNQNSQQQPAAPSEGSRGPWSVVVAMGYPWSPRRPANYTGKIILHFSHTVLNGTVYAAMKSGKKVPLKDKDESENTDDTGYGARNTDDGYDNYITDHNKREKRHFWKWLAEKMPSAKSVIAFIAVVILVATLSICIQSACCQQHSHGRWVVLNSILPGLARSLRVSSSHSDEDYSGLLGAGSGTPSGAETPTNSASTAAAPEKKCKPRVGHPPSTPTKVPADIELQLIQPSTPGATAADSQQPPSLTLPKLQSADTTGNTIASTPLRRPSSAYSFNSEGSWTARIVPVTDDIEQVASARSALDGVNISDVVDRRSSTFLEENPMISPEDHGHVHEEDSSMVGGVPDGMSPVAAVRQYASQRLSGVWQRLVSNPSAREPANLTVTISRDDDPPMAAGGGGVQVKMSEASSLLGGDDDEASTGSGVGSLGSFGGRGGGKRRKKKNSNNNKGGKTYGSMDRP